ncbi:MSF drug transporter, putative [Paecilomyces variotii No. 5]|uniref:MSF drug transporter, putative n=1 Tax=Byssochlamys spectabilis (strain No. 5 / NBRC 109023) TaxID=1356009 RepID=V5FG32_BYSSN|nr:MSF drug transporter, putative [Paecilomyces variotii No. 5]
MAADSISPRNTELHEHDDESSEVEYGSIAGPANANGANLEKQSTAASALSSMEQRAQSVISRIRSREPGQTARFTHPLSHTKTGPDVIVDFDGPDDPYRPLNWGFRKKAVTTLLYGLTTMGATWASSVYTPGINQISHQFHVGEEVSTLGLTLLLFGFGLGPLIWAPLSEVYGRKPAVLAPYFIAAIFSFGTAAAKDIQTIMLTRFFAGLFSSAPITNTGGVLSDIWSAEERGAAIVGYAMAVVGGPVLGPIVGGAIVQSYLRWRWTEYITGIMMMLFLTLDVLFLDESYPPVLLVYKARRLRHETGNWALHARHEEWDVSLKELGNKYLVRPFQLLATPICFTVALYASFVYGILYLNLASFPIEFEEERGWNLVVGALPFLALLVGIFIGAAMNILNQRFYVKRFKANRNRPVPEARLPPMMLGSIFFAAGMFIFGWTSSKKVHWIGPIIGAACMGLGFFTIFQAALNYLIDTFQKTSASAVAANTFLRSLFAGCFPLFVNPMFHNLGINWASSVLGFVSIALIPIPFLFYIFGKRIRARGKWSRASVYPD